MAEKQEILIITRNFPPYAGLGSVIRVVKFCKYLPAFDFKPLVVAVDRDPSRKVGLDRDPLLREITAQTEVFYVPENSVLLWIERMHTRKRKLARIRKRSFKYRLLFLLYGFGSGLAKNVLHLVKKWLLLPDEGVLWNRKAEAFSSRLIEQRGIRFLLTTSPPNSTHLIGIEIKKRHAITWCADFRDAWVGNPMFRSKSDWRNRREEEQEKRVLEAADLVVSVNTPIVELLQSHTRAHDKKPFGVIYNGFDPDELASPASAYARDAVNLIHCGVLYPQRTLGPFLQVVTEMADKAKPFRVYLLGKVEDRKCFEYQRRFPDRLHMLGVASRQKTLSMIRGADVALLVQSDFYFAPLSGKIFEYLACDKRVIGLVPEGIARDFIRDMGMGWSCDLADIDRIREILEEVHGLWQNTRLDIHYAEEAKSRFDRRRGARDLAALLRRDAV